MSNPWILSVGGLVLAALYHFLMPHDYPRLGLYAGLGVGVVFGSTVPVEKDVGDRVVRAIRTSIAFATVTSIGYAIYQGQIIGISWGVGGSIGCVAGCLTGQLARSLVSSEGEG